MNKKNLCIVFVAIANSIYQSTLANNTIANHKTSVQTIFGTSASEETTKLSQELLTKLDPDKKFTTVLQMNSFMRYWLAKKMR